jgi:C4-dicarboxylate-specific signal transduction histidine kinase
MTHLPIPSASTPVVLDNAIRDMVPALWPTLPTDVALTTQLNAHGVAVCISAKDLERIAVNLVTNAVDAMPNGGMVGLRTSTRLTSGKRYVRLECWDTGGDVSPGSLADLMRDGVSTKRRGTGLGLRIVRDLVRDAGGSVELMTRPEGGTVFAVMLSVLDESEGGPASMARSVGRWGAPGMLRRVGRVRRVRSQPAARSPSPCLAP